MLNEKEIDQFVRNDIVIGIGRSCFGQIIQRLNRLIMLSRQYKILTKNEFEHQFRHLIEEIKIELQTYNQTTNDYLTIDEILHCFFDNAIATQIKKLFC